MKILLLLVVGLVLASCASIPVKSLAGPPEEFGLHRVPNPANTITEDRSASTFIWFTPQEDSTVVHIEKIPVDGPGEFVFSFTSPHAKDLQLELKDPSGKVIDLAQSAQEGTIPIGDETTIPTTVYIIQKSTVGVYTLTITSTLPFSTLTTISQSSYANAVLMVINNDLIEINSHMTSYLVKQGQEIGIISTIVDLKPEVLSTENIHVTSALMEIITPDGSDIEVKMEDTFSGLSRFNIPPHSGVYGAHIPAKLPGKYIFQAKLNGWFADSTANEAVPFLRTTEHIIEVSAATVELALTANLRPKDASHVNIDIATTGTANRLRAYAEVWGKDSVTKEDKAACWIGGATQLIDNVATLTLDLKWLLKAGVVGPLTLKNVYLSDLTTTFPVSIASKDIPVDNSNHLQQTTTAFIEVTKEMRFGVNPLREKARNTTAASPTLICLPGYCSSANPFEPKYFTNAAFFSPAKGNFGNDEYTQKLLTYAQQNGYHSYSMAGHSQGGMVAVHSLNYYFSGLDNAQNGKLIQSVGTPWNGCTAAGSLANLGAIFGAACGSNNDLSLDGAVNWLSGISADARKEAHYYTTTYAQGSFFGDHCNMAMNIVLQWPNDGTTEIKYAALGGGYSMGNTQKWCHISGMKYPSQCTNPTILTAINAEAAR